MPVEIGQVEAIFRYPVKSMRGEPLEVATVGWHGLDGDRRLAFRRVDDRSGFPWLTASKLPDLLLFAPHGDPPAHVRTPDGAELPVFGEDLATEIGRRHGAPVQMMQLNHGVFDEASISVITLDTVHEIGRLAGRSPDVRRFRPNIVVRSLRSVPFQEEQWLGRLSKLRAGSAEGRRSRKPEQRGNLRHRHSQRRTGQSDSPSFSIRRSTRWSACDRRGAAR